MKKILIKTLIVSVVVLFVPFIFTTIFSKHGINYSSDIKNNYDIYYVSNGVENKLKFDEYIIGVVAANMPAGYEMEALKSQAVIARTYALYNISYLTHESNHNNKFTTSELGLSYIDLSDLKQFWGGDYVTQFTKIENAVYGTKDEILVYNKSIILPVFFDTGSGYTRNASEAWGVDIPYLISVPSKQDVTSTNYLKITEFAIADIISTLTSFYPGLNLTSDSFFDDVQVTERDTIGYVTKISLGIQTVSGEEFSKALGLNSSHFYIDNYEGKVRIICNGVGHGVGLSQYGANVMAEEGKTYQDILSYYYRNTKLDHLGK